MKKLLLLSVLIVMVFGMGGCSRSCSFELASIEHNTSGRMDASYALLSGTKEKDFNVGDETITINVDIVTKKGSINVYIINEDGEYSYEGHDLPTSDFTVTLQDSGKYTIKVEADKHKGSYSFEW